MGWLEVEEKWLVLQAEVIGAECVSLCAHMRACFRMCKENEKDFCCDVVVVVAPFQGNGRYQ